MDVKAIDVALGKTAVQSSFSQWSYPDEASFPISGRTYSDYAFHTEVEDKPWWRVDLEEVLPIDTIVIHNRVNVCQERAARIRVEIAETLAGTWILIHAGFCLFGGGGNGEPLRLSIGSNLRGRYVRLALDDHQYLHLSKVEVFASPELKALSRYCAAHNLPYHSPSPDPYVLESHPLAPIDQVVGIKVNYSGRFGNLLIQYLNVIQLAERTGLKYIQLGHHELFDVQKNFVIGDITFLSPGEQLPAAGLFLAGNFFASDPFAPVLSPTLKYGLEEEIDTHRICQTYVIPGILTGIPTPTERKLPEELTIHFRAGDIFDPSQFEHDGYHGYRQPPLSFYVLVFERLRDAGLVKRARLVYEDRTNPCIEAFEAWLDKNGVAFRTQCVSLRDDMSALVDAEHLVFGHGTYGYAACRLSRSIKTVHFFAPQLGGSYEFMPNIGEVYAVYDNEGNYIKAYEYGKPLSKEEGWRFEPEMYDRMLNYPIEALRLRREK